MTTVSLPCEREKSSHGTEHVIFSEDIALNIHSSFFERPNFKGDTYYTKRITIKTMKDDACWAMLKWSPPEYSCDPLGHFLATMNACDETSRVVAAFMRTIHLGAWKIKVVKPIIIKSSEKSFIIEPFVDNIFILSSLSILPPGALPEAADIIAAMNHFSYIYSKGKYVLKTLKGGIDEHMNITLISPTLLSDFRGQFGCEDLGSIQGHFFAEHECNDICRHMKLGRPDGEHVTRFAHM